MKKKLYSTFGISAAIILILTMLTGCSGGKADEYAANGLKDFSEGNYVSALDNLKLAEEYGVDEFDKVELYYLMGGVLFKLEDYDASINAYLEALSIDPEDFNCWANLGVVYQKAGLTEKADVAYDKALLLDPADSSSVLFYDNLGYKYISENKPLTAIDFLEQSRELSDKNPTTYALLSIAYAMSYDYDKSDEALKTAEELNYSQCDVVRERIQSIKNKRK